MQVGLDLLFLIPHESGGRETYARELTAAMFEIQPSLTATAFVNREMTSSAVRDLGLNMRVVRIPVSGRRPEQWALGELGLLPVAAARARVHLVHSLANFAPIWGSFRRVVTLHDLQYRAVPELISASRRIGTAALIRAAVSRADRIITGSSFSREEIVRAFRVPANRIDMIPYGLGSSPAQTAPPESELRERHRLGPRPVALSVASNLPHKNLATAVRALAHIPPERRPVLVVVGAGTDGPALASQAREAGVESDVRLLGFQSAEELEGLYALAACAVLPSWYEGFGLPALEAMSRGVPFVGSAIPALREVGGEAALYFAPDREQELASAVERLIDDRSLVRELVTAGRRRAAEFSWARAARATLDCYCTALAAGGTSPD